MDADGSATPVAVAYLATTDGEAQCAAACPGMSSVKRSGRGQTEMEAVLDAEEEAEERQRLERVNGRQDALVVAAFVLGAAVGGAVALTRAIRTRLK